MSMGPSLNASEVAAYLVDAAYDITAEEYDREALFFPRFTEVIDPSAMSHPPYGDKWSDISAEAEPLRRADGAPIQSSKMGQGYTPQGALHLFSRSFEITERDWEAAQGNPRNLAGGPFQLWTRKFNEYAMDVKDRLIAEALCKGGLTAGNERLYNGTYKGNDDPNPLVGYDGVPWFDAAHPNKAGTTYNNLLATALDATNLDAAYDLMAVTNAYDEYDRKIRLLPRTVMVGASQRTTITTVLSNDLEIGTSLNTRNVAQGLLEPLINPFLDEFDTDAWFVLSRTPAIRVMDSGAPVFEQSWDPKHKVLSITGEIRFGFYLTNWRHIIASQVPTT